MKPRGRLNHELERLRDRGYLTIEKDAPVVVENVYARAEFRSLKDFEARRLELLERGPPFTNREFLIIRPDYYPPPGRRPVLREDEAAEAARRRAKGR